MKPFRWIKAILRGLITAILVLLCAALFYILVIMGDAPEATQWEGGAIQPAVYVALEENHFQGAA